MDTPLKITKVGNSVAINLPKELLARFLKHDVSMKCLLAAALGFAALIASPASAQPVAACPAAPDFSRYPADREAIEYARAMGQAVNAREEAAGLNRAADLAILLLPDPASTADCAGGEPAPASSCHSQNRSDLTAYFATAVPAEQIRDVWSFLLPRAGLIPPGDPAQPLIGWRFTRLSADGQLAYNEVIAPPYIDGRRERAWQYLMHHRSGEAVMSAVTQFVQSRAASGVEGCS